MPKIVRTQEEIDQVFKVVYDLLDNDSARYHGMSYLVANLEHPYLPGNPVQIVVEVSA